jgi:hypothetical protein
VGFLNALLNEAFELKQESITTPKSDCLRNMIGIPVVEQIMERYRNHSCWRQKDCWYR